MLHKETVDKSTLDLLISLQSKDYLEGFHLVGGTAIALMIGHRKSIDIDLFSDFNFNASDILENLSYDFGFSMNFSANNTLKGIVGQVQVDILAHRYPLIEKPVKKENISMLSLKDIIAMKLNAISTSIQRVKDFIDIYYLLGMFSLEEMISFYKSKYQQHNEVNILKSLVYFEDVEISDWPVLIDNPSLKWEQVKRRLTGATQQYWERI